MRPHITILSAVTGRLWRSRLLLLEGWADVWTLPACWSVSRVKHRSFTFFSSPGGTARQTRGSPPPLATPTSGSAFFAGLLSREWPKRRNRAPRIRRSLSPSASTPLQLGRTNARRLYKLAPRSLVPDSRTWCFICFLSIIRSEGTESKLAKQTDTAAEGLTYGQKTVGTAACT